MLHFFSHVLVQKPSPKSKPCTLPEICLTYDIPLLMKGRWPRPRNRLKRFQTVKQGGTNKNTHFHTIAHPNWLEVWSCDILCFSFLDASPDFLLKSNHCVSFPLAGFYLNRRPETSALIIARMMPGHPMKAACNNVSKVRWTTPRALCLKTKIQKLPVYHCRPLQPAKWAI